MVDIVIDPAVLARFEALPDAIQGVRPREWTPEEDELLLRYWRGKNHEAVAKAIGVNVSTALKRYRELTDPGPLTETLP
jgi:DNA-directed RNA polymerase specialized sigma24 family protein